MHIELGGIYWLNSKTEKESVPHPYVVIEISTDGTLLAVGITTNADKSNLPGNVVLDPNEGGLTKPSIVDVSKTETSTADSLKEYIGTLSPARLAEVQAGIAFLQQLS